MSKLFTWAVKKDNRIMSTIVASIKIIPLYNFSLEAASIHINDKISIRKLTDKQLHKYKERWFFKEKCHSQLFDKKIKYGIVIKNTGQLVRAGGRKVCYIANEEVDLSKALYIFKLGHFSLGSPCYLSLSRKSGIKKGLLYPDVMPAVQWFPKNDCSHSYNLKRREHIRFKRLWKLYLKNKELLSLPIDLLRQLSNCDPFSYRMSAINLSTALESLLLKHGNELAFKLSVRSACLLAKDKIKRQEVRLIVNYLYTLRSLYVHGVTDIKRFRKEYKKIWDKLERIGSKLKRPEGASTGGKNILELEGENYLRNIIYHFLNDLDLTRNPENIDFLI